MIKAGQKNSKQVAQQLLFLEMQKCILPDVVLENFIRLMWFNPAGS